MLSPPVCRVQKPQCTISNGLELYILRVNQLIPKSVLLPDETLLKMKLEGSNKSLQYFQFTWQSSVHGKIACNEGGSVQDMYTAKYHLGAVSYV